MDFTFTIIELALMVLLFIVAKWAVKNVSNKWRLLYAAPSFVVVCMLIFIGFDVHHTGIYAAVALQIAALFMGNDSADEKAVRPKRILAIVSAGLIIISVVIISIAPSYHRLPIYDDFNKAFDVMKKHYILDVEKGIDWDKLYAKYKPLFKEADRTQSHIENYKLWKQFTTEFYDGHVGYQMGSEGLARDAFLRIYGNDFGLSLAKLSTGEYVAVNVEGYDKSYSVLNEDEDDLGYYMVKDMYLNKSADRLTLKNAGIKNGTVITKWNGKPIEDYYDSISYYMEQMPVRENEEFYLPMYVAGIGKNMDYGETYVQGEVYESKTGAKIDSDPEVDITYLDENGEEKTITAPSLGVYAMRLWDTQKKIDDGVNITNLTWQQVNDDTYMIRISEMVYDQETYTGSDYSKMEDELREQVLDLKAEGIKNIIFDLRSNTGGSPFFVNGVAKLFAPEGEHVSYYSAVINAATATYERGADGKYIKGVPEIYQGEDLWKDGKIILLVNAYTVSGGDDMTYTMGQYPNVKIMGFTSSNSSCQAVTQETMDIGALSFSAVPNLDENGEMMIDTRTDRVCGTPFDEKIPFTEEAVEAIFDEGTDFLLNYVEKSF
ncbi:MAG: hypothetical protein J5517_10010 [Eubacterium sp.]|nr:hypothetical protein [Eubacterium sp.]